jgi:hypothetical protein
MHTRVEEDDKRLVLTGSRQEFSDLYDELHTWTPGGGWSNQAMQFFQELLDAAERRPRE